MARPLQQAIPLQPGEPVVGAVHHCGGSLRYARLVPTATTYSASPTMVVGSPAFVGGYSAGSLLAGRRMRRRAAHQHTPRWWPAPLLDAVLTNWRLWCHIVLPRGARRWVPFTYAHITWMNLAGDGLIACFEDGEPLRLSGPWAPWCARVIAQHQARGHAART